MRTANPYPHGADLSIYPTVDVMREAYLFGFYRGYPHQVEMRIGPLAPEAAGADQRTRAALAEMRPTCHAVIVLPRKIALLRFARRATQRNVERLEYEQALLAQTSELAPVRHWRIEARLVHCDIADGVAELTRDRGIRRALYRPRWLATHRPRNVPAPSHGFVVRRFDAARLAQFAASHSGPLELIADPIERTRIRADWFARLTHEQRSARNSKSNRPRWARWRAKALSAANGEYASGPLRGMTAEQRSELARRLITARWTKYRAAQPSTPRA